MLNSKIAKSVRLALVFGAASTAGISATAMAAEDSAEEVERIEVTGSRIKRTDMEGASPIEVITSAEFEKQGRLSVADALRSVTSNSFGSFVPSSGSSAQSQSTVSLLGAGSDRTLVLIDGRRMAGSPSLGGSSANLSSIPMAAIERIEILKDGASAIYGSDAIAGVINVVLKKDYEGATFDIQIGRPSADGADSKQMSLAMGISSDKGNITFVYDHQEQGAIFDRDRDYTAASWEDLDGDGLVSIYDETVGVSYYGATIVNPDGDLEATPICDDLAANVPGFVGSLDQGSLLGGVGGGEVCGFAFANVSANMASTNRDSVMTSATYEIADDVELFARAMLSRNDSFGRYAPPAAGWDDIPVGNEHNAYDEPVDGYFRWYQIGNRDGLVTDYQQDYMVGLKGLLNDNIEWEFTYHKAKLDYRQVGRYYLSYAGLYTNLLLDIPLGSEVGINNMRSTTYQEDQNEMDHWFGGLGFSLGELGGGEIQHYLGAEYFDQSFASKYDAQSEAGLIGGSAGNTAQGERDTTAVFYEISMPILDNLIVNAAYRYDDYSDFGSQGTPSVKVEYRPTDDILLRASYSEGFRAPSLSELLGQTSFSATSATDYVACELQEIPVESCRSRQFDNLQESNNNLGPEESEYFNMGVVYSGIENFSVKVDYFDLEVTNVISDITVQDLINIELAGQLDAFEAAYPGVNLDRNPDGSITEDVVTRSENGAIMTRKGLDVDVNYNLETGFGNFSLGNVTTYLLESGGDVYFGGPMQDFIGQPGLPEWRSQFKLDYSIGDFAASWTTDVIASTDEDSVLDVGDGTDASKFRYVGSNHNPTYVVHNLNLKYHAGQYGTFTVGARNLFDKGIVRDDDGLWVNDTLYIQGHLGREVFAGYRISF
ncbi:TonB-dependent receptor plug domain-containing protein [Pseudoalteromonas sp. T1lg10]|uniref:TonB-dependent receptor plug domain-containing protein n=1 Tax=Pseudoalteromonas sp. T1lg10 TaxID=2077093 RepID=UPI000CF72947|nr:TonB-dependent receptor [Pseudoalteromonas sp. T1lg10]